MNLESIKSLEIDQKILILGLGRENSQFLEWLVNVVKIPVDKVLIADKNTSLKNRFALPNNQFYLGEDYLDSLRLKEIEFVFKSPGIWSLLPELQEFRKIKGEHSITSSLVFFFQKFREQIIAVTGTKGKSTTCSLINHFLNNSSDGTTKSSYCGNTTNISPYSFWKYQDQKVDKNQYFVIETSSFQLQDLGFANISPKYSLITNYYIDHLDQHDSVKEYWKAKDNIYKYQYPTDLLICSDQVIEVRPDILSANTINKFVVKWALADLAAKNLNSHLLGDHNSYNLALAIIVYITITEDIHEVASESKITNWLKSNNTHLQTTLSKFVSLKHRLELIRTHSFDFKFLESHEITVNLNFYDDGYATEPDAVTAAVRALTKRPNEFLWLLVAGVDKGGNLSGLAKEILDIQLKNKLFRVDYAGQVGQNLLNQVYAIAGYNSDSDSLESLKEIANNIFRDLSKLEKLIEEFLIERWNNIQVIGDLDVLGSELGSGKQIFNIVLSPSGSSFDEFKNSEERANWWVDVVNKVV
ncbi:MAG: Mur ligase family protein [Patescibacteria group bacterium]